MYNYNGLGSDLTALTLLSDSKSRSISPENPTGGKGMGAMDEVSKVHRYSRDLGKGWKVSPFIIIKPGETAVLADIEGSGAIKHIWMTPTGMWRDSIIRFYWDRSEIPSVEVPVGDFFASAENGYAQISSLAVCVNPGSAFNCYWEMPFRRHCEITMQNRGFDEMCLFFQIDYILTEIPDDRAYFHAEFRRSNPLPYGSEYIISDCLEGKGHYVGTYMYWGTNNNGWWGEGEIKFYIDDDKEYPTICGTGTEDYFCGSYNFENKAVKKYQYYSTPYAGFIPVLQDGLYKSQMRFGMYRWHITDPIRFDENLKITIQALGWRSGDRYLPLQDDISSVCFWYQDRPCRKRAPLPDRDYCEII